MFQNKSLVAESSRLRRFSLRLTKNKANSEDLLQSTFLRALESRDKFFEGSNLFHWTSKIMFNIFVSSYHRKKKYESQYDPEPIINKLAVEANQENYVDVSLVADAIGEMPPAYRKILLLTCVQGYSYMETAKILAVPVGTVRSRLSRARGALGSHLRSNTKR